MKKIFFLSCLLISTATQCMKIVRYVGLYEQGEAPLSLYNRKERYALATKFVQIIPDIDLALDRGNHKDLRNNPEKIEFNKFYTFNGHSFLSFAAMAYNSLPSQDHTERCKKIGEWTEDIASYQERKNLIKFLLQQGYKPTEKDRIFAYIIEREEGIGTPDNISDLLDQCLDDISDVSNRE